MTKDILESEIKKHSFGYKLWSCNLIIGTIFLYYVSCKVTIIDITSLYYIFFVLLVLCLFMIIAHIQDIRFKSQSILCILEKEKFEKKIEIANDKLDDLHLKSKIPCRKFLAPIIPSQTVRKWERHTDSNKIIGFWSEDFSPYIIECPHQLRDILIKLQNNL